MAENESGGMLMMRFTVLVRSPSEWTDREMSAASNALDEGEISRAITDAVLDVVGRRVETEKLGVRVIS